MNEQLNLNESFAKFLIDRGVIDEETALQALDKQRQVTQPIGRIALENRMLTMKQVFHILDEQADSPLRFGELAIALGYLNEEQVNDLLAIQKKKRPGMCQVLYNMGLLKRSVLDIERKEFLQSMESVLA